MRSSGIVRVARKSRHLLAVALLVSAAGLSAGAADAGDALPARVKAVYEINFAGFNIGTFEFNSSTEGQSYALSGSAQLSALAGLFTWRGSTHSSGRVGTDGPRPAAFTFDFKSNSKAGLTKMGFAEDAVAHVSHMPPQPPKPGTVPVHEAHLKGVLDPLSAVLALSRGASGNPCGRRLPIYDGKQRFDLLLTYRGQTQITEQRPSGQPGTAFVCRVRYVPIAGHKIDQETRFLAGSDQIEVVLRPIPSANVFVPYQITIPTVAGAATLVSRRVEIIMPGKQQIALSH